MSSQEYDPWKLLHSASDASQSQEHLMIEQKLALKAKQQRQQQALLQQQQQQQQQHYDYRERQLQEQSRWVGKTVSPRLDQNGKFKHSHRYVSRDLIHHSPLL